MDFHSVMETFAEAWVAANTHTPLIEAAEQGLINGPTTPNPSNSNHSQETNIQTQVLTIGQEPTKTQLESIGVLETKACGRQSPTDSPSNSSSMIEIFKPHKVQEVHGKCLPVHCIIEQIPGPQACGQYVELDSYAIVPNETLFSDLVRTALGKLGYSGSQILGAKGSIKVKKWKSLAFDQITENPEATVGDILGDLTTMASLHVRLYSVPDNPQEWRDVTVRNAVLELLREMSQSKLAKLCPLSQPMLSNIINNRYMGKIGKEKCQEFGQWYLTYRKQHPEGSTPEVVPNDRPVDGRLTFHPKKELPIMREWFHSCRNPSRRTLQAYVDILNQGPVRQQERPKIAYSTLKNWWKNEKQRERKNQKSEDASDDPPPKPKRKKKPTGSDNQKDDSPDDNNIQHYSGSSSLDTPPKTNNFTLINHSENESDLDRYSRKDSEINEGLVNDSSHPFPQCCPSDLSKENCKFTLLGQADHESDRHSDLSECRLDGSISNQMKDSLPIESPFFHKLHTVCIDHPHNLFSFPDPHLSIQNSSKIFCDTPGGRSNMMDANSHMSSEDDVDVGI